MLPAKFQFINLTKQFQRRFLEIDQPETRIAKGSCDIFVFHFIYVLLIR
jgi:hypothetical protein